MYLGTIELLAKVDLKMLKVAARGSIGSGHNGEGWTALAAYKPTAIALMLASLGKGSFMGV